MMNTRILMATALGAILMVAGVSGQQTSTRKKTSPRSKPSPVSKTRSPRVVAAPIGEAKLPAEQPTKTKPVETSSADKPGVLPADKAAAKATEATGVAEKSNDKTADAKVTKAPEAPLSLRDQVDAAPSGPERIRLQLKLVDHLIATEQRLEAIAELHSITTSDVFDPQGLYNAGNALARLGDSDEAINAYRKAIDQRKGKYSRALNNVGVVLLRAGRWPEAYEAFLSALKLENFRYAEASYNLGRLYAARGEADLASREWHRALKVDPEHTAAAQALARTGSAGRIRVESTTKVRSVTSGNTAENSKDSKRVEGSIDPPRAEREPKPPTVDAISYGFLQRARMAFESGNLQEAIDNYQRVISRMGGYFPPANLELSFALVTAKRNDEAAANLLRVANRDGARYPISYYFLGRLYELKGNLKLAEEAFAKAATAYGPKNAQFLLDLSRVREGQGDFKGALAAMEEYVALMERQGRKPGWSDERLTALRQKIK